jgi:hypothetical protein
MSDGRDVAVEIERDDRRSHVGEPGMLARHLVNGGIGALNRELHQVFDVGTIQLMAKGFVEDFNGRF